MDNNNQFTPLNVQPTKPKKAFYQRWWFWVIIGVVVVILFAPRVENPETVEDKAISVISETNQPSRVIEPAENPKPAEKTEIVYNHYTFAELIDELDSNALRAETNHKNEYVEIEGYFYNIDSGGKYFTINNGKHDYDYLLDSIHCSIKTAEQKNQLIDLNEGDHLLVRGKITMVGEILGYSLDVDSFEVIVG